MNPSFANRVAGALGRVPLLPELFRRPAVRRLLGWIPGADSLYGSGWDRVHPFDRLHGTQTSGYVPASELPPGEPREHAVCYAGSQPSILRTALSTLPELQSCTFVDLGCGKGRALLVASEFPFRDILGVELSPGLAATARRNAERIALRHPHRAAIRIAVGDATHHPLPPGDLVLFLYHPFDAEGVGRVADTVRAALAQPQAQRRLYVIYYNPVAGDRFDAVPSLRRRYARMLPYSPQERGFGPDATDTLVVWENGAALASAGPENCRIVTDRRGERATLVLH